MSEAKPDWASGYPSYEQIVRSWGFEVEAFETFGSWQGDHLALLSDAGRVGLVVIGYGSCSGCDELESVASSIYDEPEDDWGPVVSLAADLKSGIHWEPTRDDLRGWIDAHPENNWWSYEDEIARWLNSNLGTRLREDA